MSFVHPHWTFVAQQSEADIKEALLSGYKQGKPFSPNNFNFFSPDYRVDKVLDFGCGIGRNFPSLRSCSEEIVAYDIPEMLDACRQYADCTNVTLMQNWDEIIKYRFDVGIATLVLQHIAVKQDIDQLLNDLSQCCEFLYISTRCWIDGQDKLNTFSTIMNSGYFTYVKSNLELDQILKCDYPNDTHFDLLLRSNIIEMSNKNNEVFQLQSQQSTRNELTPCISVTQNISSASNDNNYPGLNKAPTNVSDSTFDIHSILRTLHKTLELFDNSKIEWIFISSNNTAPLVPDIRYQILRGSYQHKNMILPNSITDVFPDRYFLRKSDWSKQLINKLISYLQSGHKISSDENIHQAALNYFYQQDIADFQKHCIFTNIKSLNYFTSVLSANDINEHVNPALTNQNITNDHHVQPYQKKSARLIWAFYTCEKNVNKRELQQSHWLHIAEKDPDCVVLFFYGRDQSRTRNLSNNEIELDVDESYENLAKKTFAMFQWINTNYEFEHVVKIDDDIAVLNYQVLKSSMTRGDYNGHMVKSINSNVLFMPYDNFDQITSSLPLNNIPEFYAQGGCYSLSQSIVNIITHSKDQLFELNQPLAFEDAMIGRFILAQTDTEFTITHEENFAPSPEVLHYVSIAAGDLSIDELSELYVLSKENVVNYSNFIQSWKYTNKSRTHQIQEDDDKKINEKIPSLKNLHTDLGEAAQIRRSFEVYQANTFNGVILLTDRINSSLEEFYRHLKIDYRIISTTDILSKADINLQNKPYIIVDLMINIQSIAINFATLLQSLNQSSIVFFLNSSETITSCLFNFEMVKSKHFEVHKIGTCSFFTKR